MSTVSISGDVGLREAPGLVQALLAALEAGDGLSIDVSGLASADMTVLQVLVAARKSAAALGRPIGLAGINPALSDVLVRAGFVGADGAPRTPEDAFWTGSIVS